jgi:hypothetical protein
MKTILRLRRSVLVLLIMVSCFFVMIKCINQENEQITSAKKEDPNKDLATKTVFFQQFAGSKKCMGCHKNIYDSHVHTAHYNTSHIALEKYIKGSFEKGNNTYAYNPVLVVAMEKKDSGLFQAIYFKGERKMALPFDLVIGSGAKGQSFAYWKDNWLFQLPITYFTAADQWANSPGFPNKVMIDRPITSRCLECHTTYAEKLPGGDGVREPFDHNRIILGVDCEKCHGPAARHVEYQMQNPDVSTGKFIVNPSRLSRQQNLDLCAVCHSGNIKRTQEPFSFVAGDTLSKFFVIDTLSAASAQAGNFDVHGNQYGLLRASKCFRLSGTMTCNTCHSPHKNERGNVALFSQRCMSCHNKEHQNFCTINPALVKNIEKNCIDCHMPAQPSRAIALFLPEKDVPVASLIRSHFITIYKNETQKFLDSKKNQ